jgi:hypothetical protein
MRVKDDAVDELNESTHSLSLNENLLTNISYSLDKQQNLLQNLATKTIEFQNKVFFKAYNSI